MNVLFFHKTQGYYFPSEFFAEIKKLPKFALCLEQSCTIFSNLLLKRSRITTSEKLRAMYIHNWVVPILAQTYSIVYELCGEPESVGEACAFSFIRCWCSLAKTRKAILQNNILIQIQTLMKHYLHDSLRALFLLLAVFLSLPMLAVYYVGIDGISYQLNSETNQATVTRSDYCSGEIVILESVEHEGTAYSVTSIGNSAFQYCTGLTSVTIPNSVESIGFSAFEGQSGLTSVHISDIAAWCNIEFADYYSNPLHYAHHLYVNGEEVKDLVIPDSVTSIGRYAFYECSSLTSVTIGNSVESIGNNAFYECSSLTSATIGNSVTSIGNGAFQNCSSLTSVTIGNSVTSIGRYAFSGCSSLTSVTIPDSVTSIGRSAFSGCSSLTSVTIPNSVTSIGDYAFQNCSSLTSVTIGNSVTSIGNYAFYGCSSLTSVTIPDSVTSIGSHAFQNCSSLTSVTIGNSVTIIGSEAFCGCSSLTSVTIPDSVTIIDSSAFSGCSSLTSVTIGNSVESIGINAFYECSSLTSVTIGNSVTSIRKRAFQYCAGLVSVTIPNSVKEIGAAAFLGCYGLTSVSIGSGVKTIDSEAFSKCEGLLDVYCYAEDVPSANVNTFEGSNIKNSNLHVPAAAIDSYKAKTPWKNFGNITDLYIENPEAEKCATPFVTYTEGKLSLSCQTEGAEFVTKIASEDINTFNSEEIELTATYNVEVYALKDGMNNSDTISVALVWVENGKVGEESGVISVEAAPVLIQANGGHLTINGVAKGCEIAVYTLNGTEVARATATEGSTTINTGLQSGTVAIVKLGNKSVKIKI